MINISKIIYDKLINDSRISDYIDDNWLTIDWEQASQSATAPNLILNRITWNTNIIWRRLEIYQISIWETSKSKAEDLRNIVLDIFNRLKEWDVLYSNLENSISDYDNTLKEFWEHLSFKFKMIDSDF